ncbi:MAG: hypothetical protein R3D27_11075 [Hyphomicrobiaceae bacterium]
MPRRACVLAEATKAARSLSQANGRAEALDTIVRILTAGQRFDEAIALSAALRQDGDSLVVRSQLAVALASTGHLAEAEGTSRAIRNHGWRAVAEAGIARVIAAMAKSPRREQ